jgi:hypothetical protein
MDISDFKISCEELEQLLPVLEKSDPVWSQFLQRQIALGRHYPKEAGCVREADDRTQMDMFFLLGTTISRPDRVEAVSNREALLDYHAKGVTFYESVIDQIREAIGGKNGIYRNGRQKLESTPEALITTLVPVVLSTLQLPAAIGGAAIIIVLFISKIGVPAFCESTESSRIGGSAG